MSDPVSPRLCHNLISSLFFFNYYDRCIIISHWTFNLNFPHGNNVDLFMCLFAIRAFFSVKCLFVSFFHVVIEWFAFFIQVLRSLCTPNSSLLSDMWSANIFSHSVTSLFIFFSGLVFHRANILHFY